MSDTRRVRSDLKQDECVMSTSTAAAEAFDFLNELTRFSYRGAGDTPTAARDRAAKAAGISPAQAERVWKRWREMKTVNGDVYRALRNRYEAICMKIEATADAIEESERRKTVGSRNAAFQSPASVGAGSDTGGTAPSEGQEMK